MCADDVDLDRDRGLVAAFQAGDPAAFDELYLIYYARLVRFCERRVDHLHEAEEIAQEAFARAWGALPRLGGDQRFYPWLSVIASRLCIDALRKRSRDLAVPTRADMPAAGSDELVVDALDCQDVVVAMGRLSDRYREVLALREQLGWSYREIAEHYAVSLGTIELLLFRARRALRKEYLAINGADARIAAGIPVLGWMRTRIATWRSRVEAAIAQGMAPLTANMASVALVVGATTGVIAVSAPGMQPADASTPSLVSSSSMSTSAPAPAAVTVGAPNPSTPASEQLDPSKAVRSVTTANKGYEHAEEWNGEAPFVISVKVGGVKVGVDPRTMARDTEASVGRVQAAMSSGVNR